MSLVEIGVWPARRERAKEKERTGAGGGTKKRRRRGGTRMLGKRRTAESHSGWHRDVLLVAVPCVLPRVPSPKGPLTWQRTRSAGEEKGSHHVEGECALADTVPLCVCV
jgi:hypothetical protein